MTLVLIGKGPLSEGSTPKIKDKQVPGVHMDDGVQSFLLKAPLTKAGMYPVIIRLKLGYNLGYPVLIRDALHYNL